MPPCFFCTVLSFHIITNVQTLSKPFVLRSNRSKGKFAFSINLNKTETAYKTQWRALQTIGDKSLIPQQKRKKNKDKNKDDSEHHIPNRPLILQKNFNYEDFQKLFHSILH